MPDDKVALAAQRYAYTAHPSESPLAELTAPLSPCLPYLQSCLKSDGSPGWRERVTVTMDVSMEVAAQETDADRIQILRRWTGLAARPLLSSVSAQGRVHSH